MLNPSIIAQHESWISVDPIVGCPAKCLYCYLATKDLIHKKPEIIESDPGKIYDLLEHDKYFNKNIFGVSKNIPICFGNYTDMLLTPSNKSFLLHLLSEHKRRMPNTAVCIVTKGKLDTDFLSMVDSLGIKVIFIISISFFSK
jgi:DNA repair photolyase